MEKLEFITKTLPELITEYKWQDYEYKAPEDYVKFLDDISVYKMTQEQKQDFIDSGYEDYVEDIKVGKWVLDDDEVCYKIDSLWEWQHEIESSMKEGYQPDVKSLLMIKYAYFLKEQQHGAC